MENYRGHLCLEDRQQIHLMRSRGFGFAEIGRVIGRDRSVVKRELERNQGPRQVWRYLRPLERAKEAHERAKRRRSDCKKGKRGPLKLAAVRDKIEQLLKDGHYSPEDIADVLNQGDLGVRVSGKTIRRWIVKEAPELRQYLPDRGKHRRNRLTKRKRSKRKAASKKRSIHRRPEAANERKEAGHYEADAIVCSQSTVAIISVRERKTRKRWYRRVKNLQAETVRPVLMEIFGNIPPPLRLSCTYDNGGEFAEFDKLEYHLGVTAYGCDAYSAWQKGGVEHQNKEFRRFVPKGTDLSTVSEEEIAHIETILNAKPMDCLEKLSADQAWILELREARKQLH